MKISGKRMRAALVAVGVAAVVGLSVSAAAAASGNDQPDQSLAAQKMAAAQAEGAGKDGGSKPSPGPASQNLLAQPRAAQSVAATLGVPLAAAQRAMAELLPLSEANHGLDPSSAGFRTVADQLGVSVPQLVGALNTVKLAG